jgi:GH25 family lysozyme M1 (1,4-beta-N-acetylmuramidase)
MHRVRPQPTAPVVVWIGPRRSLVGSTFTRRFGTVGRPDGPTTETNEAAPIPTTAPARTAAGLAVAFLLLASPVGAAAAAGAGETALGGSGPEPPAVPLAPVGAIPGIDVSHHQDVIDWPFVAASGQRFVFAKATEGRAFVDPMYLINKAGAEAAGLLFGAYHFAQPDDRSNDPLVEADHFVDHALLHPGNLLPVLDIERTGGLSQDEVTAWILRWLDRVTERLGVRPIVYTSPGGWDARTGDTTAVAEAGYTVLWVAHWGVESPRLPANDWNGNGWTFWQYTSQGSVPGIVGRVDLDWYQGGSFGPVTIPGSDTTPPLATFTLPFGNGEPLIVTFDERVRNVTTDNTYVWTPGTGTYPQVELTCRNRQDAEVDCVTGRVWTVFVQPVSPLIPGETYEAVVNPGVATVLVVDRAGNPAPTTTQSFATPTDVEQDDAAVSYFWRVVRKPDAFDGSFVVERRAGAAASYEFRGRRVVWYTATGPSKGKAVVWIDGEPVGTFDQYAERSAFRVPRTFDGLERGLHEITIRVLGRGRPSATGTEVVVDAFEAGGDLVKRPVLDAAWGRFGPGGQAWASDLAGASAELTFRGTGVDWFTVRGPDQGRAEIWVDGTLLIRVDNFAAEPMTDVVHSVTGLADGIHSIRIVVLGTARPAATAELVSVDRFSVRL